MSRATRKAAKRQRRMDRLNGVIYEDWTEQQIEEAKIAAVAAANIKLLRERDARKTSK